MAEFGPILKKEIQRLARREATLLVNDLKSQLRSAKTSARQLAAAVAQQQKQIESLKKNIGRPSAAAPVASSRKAAGADTPGWRMTTVGAVRKTHGLSQNALAKLLGVGLNTVWLWEKGRTVPRVKQREALIEMRQIDKKEMAKRLLAVGLKTGKSKPGRKPGSKSAKAKPATKKAAAKKPGRKKATSKKAAKKPGRKKVAKKAPAAKKAAKKTTTRKKAPRRKAVTKKGGKKA